MSSKLFRANRSLNSAYLKRFRMGCIALGICIGSFGLPAQQPGKKLPQFETVSIKPTAPDRIGNTMFLRDGFTGENITLTELLLAAYGLRLQSQIEGLPDWARTAHYEIMARVAADDVPAMKTLGYRSSYKMLQPVLADRFSLRFHMETKTLPAYRLELSGKTARLKDDSVSPGFDPESVRKIDGTQATIGRGSIVTRTDGRVIAWAIPISMLTSLLEEETGRHVIDATGLKGSYSFEIKLAPRQAHPPPEDAASVLSPMDDQASEPIQDGLSQIGLKLVPSEAALPVLVIDEVKPPSPN